MIFIVLWCNTYKIPYGHVVILNLLVNFGFWSTSIFAKLILYLTLKRNNNDSMRISLIKVNNLITMIINVFIYIFCNTFQILCLVCKNLCHNLRFDVTFTSLCHIYKFHVICTKILCHIYKFYITFTSFMTHFRFNVTFTSFM
jgi:hypothetical protein